MVFSSLTFLFYFFPAFFLLYFLSPNSIRNLVIFIGSLVFYFYGVVENPAYLILILLSVFVNFGISQGLDKRNRQRIRKRWLYAGMIYNFGMLFVFKYLDFGIENINRILRWIDTDIQLPYADLVLPIGISFYTFQITSYLIDVYRRKIPIERSVLKLGTYLCMFPQLIAGPIITYSQVREQLADRKHSVVGWENGIREFTVGLSLKVLIANRVGGLWTQVGTIGYESISTPLAWLGIIAFSFQIYFDFYGYSLMAKGLGAIMGFTFPDNFRDPYLAKSLTEFWRRWHITLGSWFREYVYIPLGGNRRQHFRNLFIVWLLTGLWHGAGWNYVLWGLLCFVLISIEKAGFAKILNKVPLLGNLYMAVVIPLSWLVFAVPDVGQIAVYLGRLFPFTGSTEAAVYAGDFVKYLSSHAWSLGAAVVCITGLPKKLYASKGKTVWMTILLVILFWLCVYSMYIGLDDPFLYYQF